MAGAELLAALLRWAAWLREGLAVVRRRLFRARVADDPVGVLLGQLGGKGGASSPAEPDPGDGDVWPLLVGAFLYLHRMGRRNERELSDLRVYVAKNYNNKEELKNLFNNLQQHFDTRIEDVKQLIIKKGQ